jgi:hypothetical protein
MDESPSAASQLGFLGEGSQAMLGIAVRLHVDIINLAVPLILCQTGTLVRPRF